MQTSQIKVRFGRGGWRDQVIVMTTGLVICKWKAFNSAGRMFDLANFFHLVLVSPSHPRLSNLWNFWIKKKSGSAKRKDKECSCNVGDPGSTPGLGRSPGEGNGHPPQYSCLENSHGQQSLAGYIPWGCSVGLDWVTNTFKEERY